MAQYRFSSDIVSRGKGQSAVAKAAYNARENILDERTGEMKRHGHRPGLEFSGIFAPKDAPEWAQDRAQLWNEVERREDQSKRHDTAQLARSLELNFPHELDADQRRQLLRDFVREQFVRKGMVADVAIHAPDQHSDERNYHAHVLLTLREITPEGFGEKVRDWNSKELNAQWREKWAELGARYLEKAGHAQEADRYSYSHFTKKKQQQIAHERGDHEHAKALEGAPQQHMGPKVAAMERRGHETEIGNAYRDVIDLNKLHALHREIESEIAAEREALTFAMQDQPERSKGAAGRIWDAHRSSDSRRAFAAALDQSGIALAVVTKDEAARTHREASFAKQLGNFVPSYREGEMVAVTSHGAVYRLNERTTGLSGADLENALQKIDRQSFKGLDATKRDMSERADQRRDDIEAGRIERSTHITDWQRGKPSITKTALSKVGKVSDELVSKAATAPKAVGRTAGKIADAFISIISSLFALLAPDVPKTREQRGILRDEQERQANLREIAQESAAYRAGYEKEHGDIVAKHHEQARQQDREGDEYRRNRGDRER
jgi:hypothetical protein